MPGKPMSCSGKASGFAASLDLSTAMAATASASTASMQMTGAEFSVASAGDINGDGFDDLLIGPRAAKRAGTVMPGKPMVVFGRPRALRASLDLSTLDGSNGFRLDGIDADDRSGRSVVNGRAMSTARRFH